MILIVSVWRTLFWVALSKYSAYHGNRNIAHCPSCPVSCRNTLTYSYVMNLTIFLLALTLLALFILLFMQLFSVVYRHVKKSKKYIKLNPHFLLEKTITSNPVSFYFWYLPLQISNKILIWPLLHLIVLGILTSINVVNMLIFVTSLLHTTYGYTNSFIIF